MEAHPVIKRTTLLAAASAGLCLALASLIPFAARLYWRIDLFSHFRVQYFWGLAVLAPIYWILNSRRLALAALAMALLNAALIVPLYIQPARTGRSNGQESYRLLIANVNTRSRSFEAVRELVRETAPDFVLLIEIDQAWLDGLALEELGYAHSVSRPQPDNFGVGLFSLHPLVSSAILTDEHDSATGVVAGLTLEGRHLHIIGVHPPPPLSAAAAARRDLQIAAHFLLADRLSAPMILAGDFNATTWSPFLAGPLAASGLHDSRTGFGPQPTWPTGWPALLRIPIDHAFVSEEVRILDRAVGPEIGSDHLPLWLDFRLRN